MSSTRDTRLGRRFDRLTIGLFLTALIAPGVDQLVRPAERRGPGRYEQRLRARWPDWPRALPGLYDLPRRLDNAYNDQLGLRDHLLRCGSIVKLFGFGVSPTADVLPGAHGFLFYTGNHTIDIQRGVHPFAPPELAAWCQLLEARRAWCERHGCAYVFVVAPNKESIYSDFLPEACAPVGPSRLDQLVAALAREAPRVELVDLRPALHAARADDAQGYLYSPLGTHWDGRGNYVAYREIVRALGRHAPELRPFEWDELAHTEWGDNPDSWLRRMYIPDLARGHSEGIDVPPAAQRYRTVRNDGTEGGLLQWAVDDPGLPHVLWFHDSFAGGIVALLREHCASLTCTSRANMDPALVLEQRPAIVMELWVERIFDAWQPTLLLPD